MTDLTATNPQAPAENEPGRGSTAVSKTIPITPEQQARGRRGEDEMKRRLLLPNGWSGLRLLQDVRAQNCGFDFLCVHCEREIELEVKTFTHQGRVIFTSGELQEAAAAQDSYFVIGILDDGTPEHQWKTFLLCNPIKTLLLKGEFELETRLQALAQDIFLGV